MVVTVDSGGRVMRAMDEFGSVLTMAALILGICAAADWFFLAPAADGARPVQADADGGTPKFMAVAHRDRVVVADRSQSRQAAPAAPLPLTQQARLSW